MQPAPFLSKNDGDAGYRSLYLSHAERALYHLSYTPGDGKQSFLSE